MSVLDEIAGERRRQVEGRSFSPEHDDQLRRGELAEVACNYAAAALLCTKLGAKGFDPAEPPPFSSWLGIGWPPAAVWKPGSIRRMLIKAAALLVAEIERLDRAAAGQPNGGRK